MENLIKFNETHYPPVGLGGPSPVGLFNRMWSNHKVIRQGVLIGVAAIGAVTLMRYAWRLITRLMKWYARRRKKREPKPVLASCAPTCAVGGKRVQSESVRAGSDETCRSMPKCQAQVGYVDGDDFKVLGCAVRMDNWLVLPDHVKQAANGFKLELRGFETGTRLEVGSLLVDPIVVDTDMIAITMSEADFSKVSLSKPKVLPSLPEGLGSFVQLVGCFGKGTVGILKHSRIFGMVEYAGTSRGGYSGAAYMAGAYLAGFHTHGGLVNGGYSASFVMSMLKHISKIVTENSDEWLEGERKKGSTLRVDHTWMDMDDVRVSINGRYHVVPRALLDRTYGDEWRADVRSRRRRGFVDDETISLSGEAPRVSVPGASLTLDDYAPQVIEFVTRATKNDFKRLKLLCVSSVKGTSSADLAEPISN